MDRNNENSKSQPESNSNSANHSSWTSPTQTTTTSPPLSSQSCSSNGSRRIRQEGQVSEIAWQVYHSHGVVLGHSRCEWDGEVGTICYIGPVASSSQYPTLWYAGIVWQQPGSPKAKHNGTVWDSQHNEWVCHFQVPPNTTHTTTCTTTSNTTTNRASFVKWSKLQHHLGHGLDLKLVQRRYVRRDCPQWETTDDHVFGPHAAVATTVPGQYKLIEFYGEAQLRTQQELGSRQLTTLSLRRAGLSHVVSTQAADWQLVQTQPSTPTPQDDNDPKDPQGSEPLQQQQQQHALQYIRKLDVAGNLISDWHVVADLLHLVPHQGLLELNLSYNRLSGPILVGPKQQQQQLEEDATIDQIGSERSGPAPSPQSLDVEQETAGETSSSTTPGSLPQPRPPPKTMRHDQLQHLNVRASHLNPGQPFATVLEWLGHCFPQLQTLGLSQNPNLFGATCSLTTTTTTTTPQSVATALPWLERLDVSECGLASLQDVWHALARLPRLASWNLMDNPLQQLQLTTTTTREPSCPFSSLQQLQLSGTLVETWSDLLGIGPISLDKNGRATDKEANDTKDLNRNHQDRDTNNGFPRPYLTACLFPALSSLRLDQTPLTQAQGVATTRSTLIARLGPQLQTLNGTAISDRERTDAERRFVRTWSKPVRDWQQQQQQQSLEQEQNGTVTATTSSLAEPLQPDTMNKEKDPEAQHHAACFWYLASQHHSALLSHPLSSTNSSSSSSGADWSLSLVSVTLCSHAPNSCDMAALHRRLPLTLTIAKLHALLARHYGLEVDRQELRLALPTTTTCRSSTRSAHTTTTTRTEAVVPTVLDDPDRDLTYFGVVDGCTIYMHERDDCDNNNGRAAGEPSSSNLTTDHQHEQRIEQQEAEWRDFRNRQSRHAPQGTHRIQPTTNEP